MNSETIHSTNNATININESYFFKAELFLWTFYSINLLLHWSGLSVRFGIIEMMLQLIVISLAIYAGVVPFIKSWYNLEDLSSAVFNIAGIILLTTGATASYIYQLPWGTNVFMAGFVCTCYYHMLSPFRERTYQNTNKIENQLVWYFVIGCLLSFPACFIYEDLFPYPHAIFIVAAGIGFWILLYTLFSFCRQWYRGQVQNYLLLSYVPRILVMAYFSKGYEQFFALKPLLNLQ